LTRQAARASTTPTRAARDGPEGTSTTRLRPISRRGGDDGPDILRHHAALGMALHDRSQSDARNLAAAVHHFALQTVMTGDLLSIMARDLVLDRGTLDGIGTDRRAHSAMIDLTGRLPEGSGWRPSAHPALPPPTSGNSRPGTSTCRTTPAQRPLPTPRGTMRGASCDIAAAMDGRTAYSHREHRPKDRDRRVALVLDNIRIIERAPDRGQLRPQHPRPQPCLRGRRRRGRPTRPQRIAKVALPR
jgi:hypothetical protein